MLFENEKIESGSRDSEVVKMSDEEINKKYRDGEIRICLLYTSPSPRD